MITATEFFHKSAWELADEFKAALSQCDEIHAEGKKEREEIAETEKK